MKRKFVIELNTNMYQHKFLIYADVPEKEFEDVKAKLKNWSPKTKSGLSDTILMSEIYNSLKELTGYEFRSFNPDFIKTFGYNQISFFGLV